MNESSQNDSAAQGQKRPVKLSGASDLILFGRNLTPPPSGGEPEFVPATVVASFGQGVQMAQPRARPKLSAALAPALAGSARRFHRAAADRPTLTRQRLVVHAPGLVGNIVLFPPERFPDCASLARQRRQLPQHRPFLPVAQPMQPRFHPFPSRRFVPGMQRLAQVPEMLAGAVKVQELMRLRPTAAHRVPNPRRAIGHPRPRPHRPPRRRNKPAGEIVIAPAALKRERLFALPSHRRWDFLLNSARNGDWTGGKSFIFFTPVLAQAARRQNQFFRKPNTCKPRTWMN